nr:ASCH domain-containing protein [Latilactobacillus sakei]
MTLGGQGKPVAITKKMRCKIIAYNKVSADYAYLEGEGNRTLAYWRAVHDPFFAAEYAELHRTFEPTIPCLCERFIVVKV